MQIDDQKPGKGIQFSPPAADQPQKTESAMESERDLREAIEGSKEVLATATSAVPLFPDTVTVDRAKLTVTKRTFFATKNVMSMRIEDVLNVTAATGPFFGSITIVSRVLHSDPYTVNYFWKKDAARIKRVTQGYIIALQRGIDVSSLSTDELARQLDELGEDKHIPQG